MKQGLSRKQKCRVNGEKWKGNDKIVVLIMQLTTNDCKASLLKWQIHADCGYMCITLH